MRTVSLREHETAWVGDQPGDKRFTVGEIEALDRAQRVVGVEAFRWSARNQIKAAQYVGMVVTGDVRLEILPKIDQGKIHRRFELTQTVSRIPDAKFDKSGQSGLLQPAMRWV